MVGGTWADVIRQDWCECTINNKHPEMHETLVTNDGKHVFLSFYYRKLFFMQQQQYYYYNCS